MAEPQKKKNNQYNPKDDTYAWSEPVLRALQRKGFTVKESMNIIYNIMAESGGKMVDEKGNKSMYKGRGYIQLTGKNNYEYFGKKLGIDLVNKPELANDPQIAADITAEFFSANKAWKKIKDYEAPENVIKALAPKNANWADRQAWLTKNKIRPPEYNDFPLNVLYPNPTPSRAALLRGQPILQTTIESQQKKPAKKVAIEDHPMFSELKGQYDQGLISLGTFYEKLQSNPEDEQV
jgi:hypothetical protein